MSNEPTVTMLDHNITASQITDEPLQVKVTVTSVYIVEGTTPDQAIVEVSA